MNRALRATGYLDGLFGSPAVSTNVAYLGGFYAGALARLRFN